MKLLSSNITPKTIKKLDQGQLLELAREIRDTIIQTVSKTGGHLASNLGVVEITLALHHCLNMPDDKIVWDVGHQCYPHKLLTGRFDRFHTLRQFRGISGFPKSSESCFDCYDAGHSGTSISAALGMAIQRDLMGLSHKVVAVIGDASLTNGMALEAMNHAGYMGTDMMVLVNDNEKSISKNVGAYSRHLSKLRMELLYRHAKQKINKIMHSLEADDRDSDNLVDQLKERIKHVLTPSRTGAVFQELGFMYFGPINGHDIELLCNVFESIKDLKGPVLVHTVTSKGKGYKFAEQDSTKFHGIGSFNSSNGNVENKSSIPSYTSIYGKTIVDVAREDDKIVAITAAMKDGTGLTEFAKEFPSRFFDVGIAEEHAVTFAGGLAKEGAKPIVTIYSTFLQRAYDQILHDVCLQSLPVKFMIDRGGLVGDDGPTHHGIFDLSYLRNIPNMVIMSPKDGNELRHMVKTAVEYDKGPIALRYPRGETAQSVHDPELRVIPIGKSEIVQEGEIAAIFAIGSTVYPSLHAAMILNRHGLNVSVINARFVKPLDEKLIEKIIDSHHYIITVEENVLAGGFGSAVMEYLSDNNFNHVKVKRIGLPDSFIEHGEQSILKENYGLTPEKMAETIENFLHQDQSKQHTFFNKSLIETP